MKRLLSIAVSLLFVALPGTAAEPGEAIDLRSKTLRLNVEDPEQSRIGRLLWRGGLELISNDDRLGGLSGLWLSPDAERAVAISDEGRWASFSLTYDSQGNLVGVGGGQLGALLEPDGRSLAGEKLRGDAEALARLPGGEVLVSFERDHRLNRYQDMPPAGRPIQGDLPGNHKPRANQGMESLTPLPGGGLLAISEGLSREVDGREAWQGFVAANAEAPEWRSFHIPKDADLAPVDAQLGPGGRQLYWLERGFSILGGLRVKLKRAPLEEVLAGRLLEPEELAFLKAPLTLDNFEGLWLREGPAGQTLITLLSDDNFNPPQRTLLVQFELVE